MTSKKPLLLLGLFFLLCSCQRVDDKIEPQVKYSVHDRYLKGLQPCFPALTYHEKNQEWGKEYQIGVSFAKDLDLYRAITALKRANILISDDHIYRKAEIQYFILLSYYLGARYQEVIDTFENSELSHVSDTFPAYKDLLVMLYDSFIRVDQAEKAGFVLELMEESDTILSNNMKLQTAISHAEFDKITCLAEDNVIAGNFQSITQEYKKHKKSTTTAQFLNAVIPGSGFLYVGQKQSALTAFLLNGLFIGAATHFFMKGNYAAGFITTSFEAGWYFGGIYGAGEAAKLYNERVYETGAQKFMRDKRLFPVLMIEHAF